MAVRKVFWEDPYRRELPSQVGAVIGNEVALTQTILYAFSGGQESDGGTIGGHPVLSARKEGLEIWYALPEGHGLQPGQGVDLVLDWTRRYRLMRLHFAAELVLECTYRACPGIEKIGAHIAADKARIDFATAQNMNAVLPGIAEAVAALVGADHPIISAFSDEAAQRRYWEIADFARVACGGTHLARTGEVGALHLRRKNVGGGKERLEISLQNP
jgi:Ser-tRNA(Ala) deacylase AlaX